MTVTLTHAQWVELGLTPSRYSQFIKSFFRSQVRVIEGRYSQQAPHVVQLYDPGPGPEPLNPRTPMAPIPLGHFRDHAQALQVATILALIKTS